MRSGSERPLTGMTEERQMREGDRSSRPSTTEVAYET